MPPWVERIGMKIFYYVLDSSLWTLVPVLKIQEIEVEEKPKTYLFRETKPSGYYNQRVSKEDIGIIQKEYSKIYLFLMERNDDFAKRKFVEYLNSQIEVLKNQIKEVEEKKRIVMDFKEEA